MNDYMIPFIKQFSENRIEGKVGFQKLVYFSQEAGVPLGYRFGIHLYGPYSPTLDNDIQSMEMEGILNLTITGRTSAITPGPIYDFKLEEEYKDTQIFKGEKNYILQSVCEYFGE